jgi:hypothetical protein
MVANAEGDVERKIRLEHPAAVILKLGPNDDPSTVRVRYQTSWPGGAVRDEVWLDGRAGFAPFMKN